MSKPHKRRRKLLFIGGGILFIAALAIGGWLIIVNMVQPAPEQNDEFSRERELDSIASKAEQKAQEASSPEEGAKVYDEAISQTEDQTEKSQLMASKAAVYLNEEKYDEALAIALEAEKVKASSEVSALIAQLYELKGDRAKAATYYEKAARLVNVNEPMGQSDKKYFENQAKELRGSQ